MEPVRVKIEDEPMYEDEADNSLDKSTTRSTKKTKTAKRLQTMRPNAIKIVAVQRVKKGESKASVARDLNIPESTLRGWCKSEDRLLKGLQDNSMDRDSGNCTKSTISPTPSRESINSNNNSNDNTDHINRIVTSTTPCISPVAAETVNTFNRGLRASNQSPPAERSNSVPGIMIPREFRPYQQKNNLLWHWLTTEGENLRETALPLDLSMNNPTDFLTAPFRWLSPFSQHMNIAEAIGHGECFLKWLEETRNPLIAMDKVAYLKELLQDLKSIVI